MFLGHIALLRLLFSSCAAAPNELFLLVCDCVCVCVCAFSKPFPYSLHINNTAALAFLVNTLVATRKVELREHTHA